MTENMPIVEIQKLMDSRKLGSLQIMVLLLCGFTVLLDGFDTQSIAFVAPSIVAAWHLEHSALGPIFVASLVGVLIGALAFGTIADKVGRRPLIMIATLLFGLFTLLTAQSDSVTELLVFRFLTGIGLGGAIPNTVALTAEYSPERRRATMVMMMFIGFPLGASIGGGLAALIIPHYGWRSVWYVGGTLPILLVIFQYIALPESLRILVMNAAPRERITSLIRRLAPDFEPPANARFDVAEMRAPGVPVRHLFLDNRAAGTVLLWIVFFTNLLEIFFVQNWIPALAHSSGLPIETAVIIGTLLQVGGVVAAISVGVPIDRYGAYKVLALLYGFGWVLVVIMGQVGNAAPALMALSFCIGFCVVGGQISAIAHAAIFYPTAVRSTGVGWALGIGRVGAIVGPLAGGMLIALHWSNELLFFVAAIPLACAAVAISFMGYLYGHDAVDTIVAEERSITI